MPTFDDAVALTRARILNAFVSRSTVRVADLPARYRQPRSVVAAALASYVASSASGITSVGWATAYFMTVTAKDVLVVLGKATLSG